jgi:hypothetical protein
MENTGRSGDLVFAAKGNCYDDASLESVCRRQALISWFTRRIKRRDRMEMKAISMKAARCSSVRSKMVCVLQTYMGKEFNVNGQTV